MHFKKTILMVCLLTLSSCQRLTSDEKEKCLKYKYTTAIIIEFTIIFYPDFDLPHELSTTRKDIKKNPDITDENQIKDSWGNAFSANKRKQIVYSFGENQIDEEGAGDDIFLGKSENHNFYCPER